MLQVTGISAFKDNYIWAITTSHSELCWIVDPGDEKPVLDYLARHNKKLAGVLVTHHHWDHTTGIKPLLERFPDIPVYGSHNSPYEGISHSLIHAQTLTIFEHTFTVWETPGHTQDHICFISDEISFTGDTLFNAGCGRLLQGTAKQLYHSLSLLMSLPEQTLIYCTHEYTLANLAFAHAVEPENKDISRYIEEVRKIREKNIPSIPTSFGLQKKINPFLRTHLPEILKHVPLNLVEPKGEGTATSPFERFRQLRAWKDIF